MGLLMIFVKRTNQRANRFVGFIVIIIAFWQTWVLVTTTNSYWYFGFLYWIPFSCILAIGPCIYFYTKLSGGQSIKFKTMDCVHFIPLLIEWFIFYGFRPEEDLPDYQTYNLISARFALQFFAVISIFVYSYYSIKIINKHSNNNLNSFQNSKLMSRVILIFAGLWFILIPYALVNNFAFNYYLSDYDFYPLHVVIWFFTLWITAKVFLRPEIVLIESNKRKNKQIKIPSKQILDQANWLNQKMKSDKYYLNPDLTIQLLSTELGIHSNKISQTINEGLNKSFSDFVNEYRINEVIEKLNNTDYSNITVLGIAYDSGFNSKTTFNRAFRKIKGETPVSFKEKLSKG